MCAFSPSVQTRPLCHEHHVQMEIAGRIIKSNGNVTESSLYACSAPDCLVQYDDTRGYFVLGQEGGREVSEDLVPKVTCPADGSPMYLAETKPEKRDFRLWRCPQCGWTRTNDDNLNPTPLALSQAP